MIETATLTLILSAHLVAAMSPGPDFFIVMKNSLQSKKKGLLTSLGISAGILVHLTYSFLGLAVIIAKSVVLFTVVKYAGATYLLYLAWRSFTDCKENKAAPDQQQTMTTQKKAFMQGFVTNILNPKAAIYFVSLFSLIITPKLTVGDIVLVSTCIVTLTIAWFTTVTLSFSLKPVVRFYHKFERKIQKMFGVILAGLGLKVLTSD